MNGLYPAAFKIVASLPRRLAHVKCVQLVRRHPSSSFRSGFRRAISQIVEFGFVSDINTKNSTNDAVRTFAMSLPPVEPFLVASMLPFGIRSATDQALA